MWMSDFWFHNVCLNTLTLIGTELRLLINQGITLLQNYDIFSSEVALYFSTSERKSVSSSVRTSVSLFVSQSVTLWKKDMIFSSDIQDLLIQYVIYWFSM